MDGYIERQTLQDIADAIREKNGSSDTYTPSEMAEAIRGIEGGGELDFSEIYNNGNFANSIIKDTISNAKTIKNTTYGSDFSYKYQNSKEIFFPDISLPNVTSMNVALSFSTWKYVGKIIAPKCTIHRQLLTQCKSLLRVELIDTSASTRIDEMLSYCDFVNYIKLSSIDKVTYTNKAFNGCPNIRTLEFDKWKQTNISLSSPSKLTPSSIHYIIQNAMSLADGATARTLTLHATAKANWEASEYYQEDLAVLEEKGITIA